MTSNRSLVVGQFSTSPVLTAAHALGMDSRHGLAITTVRVPSSPGQFTALRDGDIDVAITSPDNVLLYATTDRNPIGELLDVRMIRAIDRGLGLTLVTDPALSSVDDFAGRSLGVDVIRSGFALLLFTMLDRLGVARSEVGFPEHGSTPKRLESLLAGDIDGTILNAESRISALAAGMRPWSTSVDVSPQYLGTVLAVPAGFDPDTRRALLSVWEDATSWLLEADEAEAVDVLGSAGPVLGSADYLNLLRDPAFGLLRDPEVEVTDLEVLAAIRRECGAYAPEDSALPALAGR